MSKDQATEDFLYQLAQSFSEQNFVKLTLSKPADRHSPLRKVMSRPVDLKKGRLISFTYRYLTKDEVKNLEMKEAGLQIENWLADTFLNADLFTLRGHYTLRYNKKRKGKLMVQAATHTSLPATRHDHQKERLIDPSRYTYLNKMGITDSTGNVLKNGQKKFRQINKYVEIIDGILNQHPLPDRPRIVDMGSGKGYLTFALYDYLLNHRQVQPCITGIELRESLVDFCNQAAEADGFEQLHFTAADIHDFTADRIDMLIALHACDILTDVAIAKGIKSKAEVIIVAPCCHKQVRKQMNCPTDMQAILRHGILEERQAELLTDGIRSLLLEAHGYKTKVFEFISTEHTPKNVMIVATKAAPRPQALNHIKAIKESFGIGSHYLEGLLE